MPQGVQQPATVDNFLKTILRSGIMDRSQLQEAIRKAPREARTDANLLADYLVRQGKLSRFQSKKLLEGTAQGLVLGPFQVLAPIGRGGMGTVYLARDIRSQHLLALKVLPPSRAKAEERLLVRFRREMEMCQRVAHPHLAWTFEVGLCQGVHYIAMEYIPGKSLFRIVMDSGPLSSPRAARLFCEIAAALDHAHHQGIIHRDIKPSNVLITPHDHAKVLDLGLALVQGESSAKREVIGGQGYVVGTMDYIAPEQAEDPTKVDARSDIYALGCSLYFVLTGQAPFPGGTNKDKIRRHRTEEPTPLAELNSSVPTAFAELIHKMMAKDPEIRPRTAHAVQMKLERWAAGEPRLPLDRPTDTTYELAVQEIEDRETVPPDITEEVIPLEGAPEGQVDEDGALIDALRAEETPVSSVVIAEEVPPSAAIVPAVPTAPAAPLRRKTQVSVATPRSASPKTPRLLWLYATIAAVGFLLLCGFLFWLVR